MNYPPAHEAPVGFSSFFCLLPQSRRGGTPTYRAARYGVVKVVRALVTAGADVNQSDDTGGTPLLLASYKGHLPVVQCLVTAGAAIDQAYNVGMTPLLMASYKGHLPVV